MVTTQMYSVYLCPSLVTLLITCRTLIVASIFHLLSEWGSQMTPLSVGVEMELTTKTM